MKFDSNLAWKQASSAIAANRELLLALAGVFYLLPALAVSLLFPQPEMPTDPSPEEAMALMGSYYGDIMPFVIPMLLFQAAGTLALLTLLTDKSRPTVGEAIKLGLKGLLPYFLAQIILAIGVGLIGGLIFGVGTASGNAGVAAISLIAVGALVIYAMIKTSLVAPAIVVEGEGNPVAALRRSWLLTKGNSLRLAVFYALVLIAFLVVILIASAIIGSIASLVAGAETGEVILVVISSILNAIMALYFVAIIAAAHRQLAGPPASAQADVFD